MSKSYIEIKPENFWLNHDYDFHYEAAAVVGHLAVGVRQRLVGQNPYFVRRNNQPIIPCRQWKT
jgi:hypothetical protein